MENIRIRELEASDTDDIADIYASIVRKPVDLDFKALIEKHARTDNDICFVADLDGRVIGFMISYILTFGFGIEKSAWIATLGVDPEFMGQGIGDRLAREIFKLYKQMGISRVYTSVRWDSTDLLSFFKSLGFDRSKFINLKKNL
ncbi:N-acetyltransferase family protein [Desulfosarcina sp.]|uniref:GNAT family N-acetyltransferase n=1 Tax=Desulfosarcina sp. TaxID=2027861 RepID=UPI0039706A6F